MELKDKQELVRLLALYQTELLQQNDDNYRAMLDQIPFKWTKGVHAQYEHARIISAKLSKEIQEHILV